MAGVAGGGHLGVISGFQAGVVAAEGGSAAGADGYCRGGASAADAVVAVPGDPPIGGSAGVPKSRSGGAATR